MRKLSWEEIIYNFFDKIDIGGEDECWEWNSRRDDCGYGRIDIYGRPVLAHRFSYKLQIGEIPSRLDVLHSCDNPPCCNPKHFFLGTQADNMKDKMLKGRAAKGSNNGNSTLTESKVIEMRKLHSTGLFTTAEIASIFNEGLTNTHYVINRKTWRHM